MDKDIEEIIEAERARVERTRARHARETAAQTGEIVGVSREMIRQVRVINNTFSDGKDLIASGQATVSRLYNLAVGDERVGLYVKIDPQIKEDAKDKAADLGLTLAEFVELALKITLDTTSFLDTP